MKMNLLVLLMLLLASAVFAEAADPEIVKACEETCCEDSGGSWDGYTCDGADETYYDCVSECTETITSFSETCCCGSALILLVAGAAVFVKN